MIPSSNKVLQVCLTPVAVPTGVTIPLHYHEAPITYPVPTREGPIVFTSSEVRNDSGYGEATVCSMNVSGHSRRSHSTVQEYLSSISSSSLSSTGRYYAGERAVPWQTSNSDIYSGVNTTVSSHHTSPRISPVHFGPHHQIHTTRFDAQASSLANDHARREQLPMLAPLHGYTSPEKSNIQYLDIANMAVTP